MVPIPLKMYAISPTIIATTNMLDNPVNARIPKTARTHKTRKTEAIARKGLGRILIIAPITKKISKLHNVTG